MFILFLWQLNGFSPRPHLAQSVQECISVVSPCWLPCQHVLRVDMLCITTQLAVALLSVFSLKAACMQQIQCVSVCTAWFLGFTCGFHFVSLILHNVMSMVKDFLGNDIWLIYTFYYYYIFKDYHGLRVPVIQISQNSIYRYFPNYLSRKCKILKILQI